MKALPYRVEILHDGVWDTICRWMLVSLSGRFEHVDTYKMIRGRELVTIRFEKSQDAVLFKLRWG